MTRDQGAGIRDQGSAFRGGIVVVGLALVFAAGSWVLPWWVVPLLAAGVSFGIGTIATPGRIAAGAGLGWAALLALGAARAPVGKLAGMLGALLHTPAAVLVLLTVLFPAVLAWSAAVVAARGRGELAAVAGRAP